MRFTSRLNESATNGSPMLSESLPVYLTVQKANYKVKVKQMGIAIACICDKEN